jgi:hypothetical protein
MEHRGTQRSLRPPYGSGGLRLRIQGCVTAGALRCRSMSSKLTATISKPTATIPSHVIRCDAMT